jgi:polysaccharide biosynthesis protein PslH
LPAKLEVLWVLPICPFPPWGGSHQRLYHLIRSIGARHSLTIVYPAAPGAAVPNELREVCTQVVVAESPRRQFGRVARVAHRIRGRASCIIPPEMDEIRASVASVTNGRRFDLIIGSLAVSSAFPRGGQALQVIDQQNVESDLYRQLWRRERPGLRKVARFHDWLMVRRIEAHTVRRADVVTACSARDLQEFEQRFAARSGAVVPNGVDTATVRFSETSRMPDRIIMVGGMSWAPNVDGAAFLVKEIMPLIWRARPDITLDVVGSNPAPEVLSLAGPRVNVTGTVPDVSPYLTRAALEVVPLKSGGGTRLKILEAMASGTPVVSTTIGAEGIDVATGRHVVIADSAPEIADAVIDLLQNPHRAREMASRARQLAEDRYDWSRVGADFVAMLESKVRSQNPGAPDAAR